MSKNNNMKKIKVGFSGQRTYLVKDVEEALKYAKNDIEMYPHLNLYRTGFVHLEMYEEE